MCQQCNEPPSEDRIPSVPLLAKRDGISISRRTFIGVTAVAGGALAGLWSCRNDATPPRTASGSNHPVTTSAATRPQSLASAESRSVTTVAESQAANTQTAAITSPAPDLGAELFPDAQGHAIARASDAPVIVVPRTDWTLARPRLDQIQVMNGIDKLTVHHSAGKTITDAWQPTAGEVEGIREFHTGTAPGNRQWADIAYHFVVDRAGRVWQARPLAYQGAHARGHNEHNVGIVLLGDFEIQFPSAAQLWSLTAFIPFLRKLYVIERDQIFTHGELVLTACPGKHLQEFMDRARKSWAT